MTETIGGGRGGTCSAGATSAPTTAHPALLGAGMGRGQPRLAITQGRAGQGKWSRAKGGPGSIWVSGKGWVTPSADGEVIGSGGNSGAASGRSKRGRQWEEEDEEDEEEEEEEDDGPPDGPTGESGSYAMATGEDGNHEELRFDRAPAKRSAGYHEGEGRSPWLLPLLGVSSAALFHTCLPAVTVFCGYYEGYGKERRWVSAAE